MNKVLWIILISSFFVSLPVLGACPSTDLSRDCYVDLKDLVLLFEDWLLGVDCPLADLDGDCYVNSNEFALISEQWLTGNPLPEDLVVIPAGTFDMGDSIGDGDYSELPVHSVSVNSFCMGKFEITNEQYCNFLKAAYPSQLKMSTSGIIYGSYDNSSRYPYCDTSFSAYTSQISFVDNTFRVRTKGGKVMTNHPMVCVSWYGAVAYCNWRSQQEGKQPCYDLTDWTCDSTKNGYRLPTEAEWEYAARGGRSGNRFSWGDSITHKQANYFSRSDFSYDISLTRGYHPDWKDGIYPYSSPVGSFPANEYGLFDMVGNVWEWCHDWKLDSYYSSSPPINPTGPATGGSRVFRGGGFSYLAINCRVAQRNSDFQYRRGEYLGFRIVLSLE